MTGFFHVNSARLLDYWIRYIDGNKVANNEEERIMRNMLYYTFYKKHPAKCGFQSIDEGIESVLKETFVRDEVLQILKYNRKHISFVAGEMNTLIFVLWIYTAVITQIRLWLHLDYLQRQNRRNSERV